VEPLRCLSSEGGSLWHHYKPFDLSSIINFDERHFHSWVTANFGAKEKSFLVDCLVVLPHQRLSATKLLEKSLFFTGESTTPAANHSNIDSKLEELIRGVSSFKEREHWVDVVSSMID
jgi:hypothetical protein